MEAFGSEYFDEDYSGAGRQQAMRDAVGGRGTRWAT